MGQLLDLEEQSAVYRELRQFKRSDVFHWHRTGLIRLTEGVNLLVKRASVQWFIDMIAIGQIEALRDPALREFQLWEFWMQDNGRAVVTCSRDSEDVVYRTTVPYVASALDYVRLYLEDGLLMLPSEHRPQERTS